MATDGNRTMRWRRLLPALLLALAMVAAACGNDDDDAGGGDATTTTADGGDTTTTTEDGGDDDGEGAAATFEFVPLDVGGPITKEALSSGDVDIALLFTSDGAIAANEWVLLEDDMKLQPADNFAPAIREDASNDDILAVLDAVSAAMTTEAIQTMVAAVSIDGENPDDVARQFLEDEGLPGDLTAEGSLTVGAANFAESEIAAELYAIALEDAGVDVSRSFQLGSREAYFPALEGGDIDLIPEFIGTLLTFLGGTSTSDTDETVEALREAAGEKGVLIGEPAEADSKNGFVVTKETAEKYDLATISDLASVEDPLKFGGPPECPERDFCLIGLEDVYGLQFES